MGHLYYPATSAVPLPSVFPIDGKVEEIATDRVKPAMPGRRIEPMIIVESPPSRPLPIESSNPRYPLCGLLAHTTPSVPLHNEVREISPFGVKEFLFDKSFVSHDQSLLHTQGARLIDPCFAGSLFGSDATGGSHPQPSIFLMQLPILFPKLGVLLSLGGKLRAHGGKLAAQGGIANATL
jgi:hypothetical protein